jgi:DNA-binding transcriptional LysR family regulator
MTIRDLDCFIEVYECRSMSIASEKLFISAQGLSNAISRLESELNCVLFNRDRAGSVPTLCGELFYNYAVKAKSEYDNIQREIEHASRMEKGIVRIGYSFGVMSGITMDITNQFQSMHPEYELDFAEMPDKVVEDLILSKTIDIGFAAYINKENFDCKLISESAILFVPSKSSRFWDRETVSVEEIAKEPLTLRNKNFATTRILMDEFRKCGKKPEIILNTGGIIRSIKLSRDNKANTVILDSVAAQFDNLHTIPFTENLRWPMYMIMKKGTHHSKAADAFISFMNENSLTQK